MSDEQRNAKDKAGPEEIHRYEPTPVTRPADDDTEGHMPWRYSPEPVVGSDDTSSAPAADTEGHGAGDEQLKAKDEAGPEEAARANYGIPGSPDADTEGHMPWKYSPEPTIGSDQGAPETPVTDSPDADAEGHGLKWTKPDPATDADEEASTGGGGTDDGVRPKI